MEGELVTLDQFKLGLLLGWISFQLVAIIAMASVGSYE